MVANENTIFNNGIIGNKYSQIANCNKWCNKAEINGSKW